MDKIDNYISLDFLSRAEKFRGEIVSRVFDLDFMPFRYRKSLYIEDGDHRDLIYKGYCVVYRIRAGAILVADIIKNRLIM